MFKLGLFPLRIASFIFFRYVMISLSRKRSFFSWLQAHMAVHSVLSRLARATFVSGLRSGKARNFKVKALSAILKFCQW